MVAGDPVPLGLFAFGATTLVLSCYTAGLPPSDPLNLITGMALFHGGLLQLLVGICEMFRHNSLSATIFTSFGSYWLAYASLQIPSFGVAAAYSHLDTAVFSHAVAISLAAWAFWTLLLLISSLGSSPPGLIILFCSALLTFILLSASSFVGVAQSVILYRMAGWSGILTAITAMGNGMHILLASMEPFPQIGDSAPKQDAFPPGGEFNPKQETSSMGAPAIGSAPVYSPV
ncbi:hypothetical protein L7F22_059485 [Adiantum nelumboides]|nr:hypothetical protein [Adiantum nelumboides]